MTRKVTGTVARIKHGLADSLALSNLDVERDWSFAGNYVEAMWRMLQQKTLDDFIIATGKTTHCENLLSAFLPMPCWITGLRTGGPGFFRPAEVNIVVGDNGKAVRNLGWVLRMEFEGLLMEADLRRVTGDEAGIRYCPE